MLAFDNTICSSTHHPTVTNLYTNIVSSLLQALGGVNVALHYSDKLQNKINTHKMKPFILQMRQCWIIRTFHKWFIA